MPARRPSLLLLAAGHRALGALAVLALAALTFGACADSPATRGPSPLGGDSSLREIFREAERVHGVPAEILATVAYVETRLRFIGGEGTPFQNHEDGHGLAPVGIMALTPGGVRDTQRAAELAGVPEGELFLDTRANIMAAAALLADLAPGDTADLSSWAPALRAYAGGDEAGESFADEVFERLHLGWQGTDATGAMLICSARAVKIAATSDDGFGKVALGVGYPSSIWNPAYSGNYSNSNRGAGDINFIVIHTMQGSYGGTISWFKNPDANVSSQYVMRSSDGEITQMVDDRDTAWHDGCFNSNSIGIEHEGFVADPELWYTEAMYVESAKLSAWLAEQYDIPIDRNHIMGHGETPDCSDHTDPGPGWNWAHYMDLVKRGGEPSLDAKIVDSDFPATMRSGQTATAYLEFENLGEATWGIDATRLGTQMPRDRESAFFLDGSWLAPNRATGADAAGFAPGGVGRFSFELRAPEVTEPTVFIEHFQLVQEGESWFGPIVSLSIEVVPASDDDVVGGDGDGGDLPDPSDDDPTDDSNLEGAGCSTANGSGVSSGGFALLLLGAVAFRRRRPGRRERGLR